MKKEFRLQELEKLKNKALDDGIEIGYAQENWYKAANVLIDKYLRLRYITPTEFAFYHVVIRYTKGFGLDERPFSLTYLQSIAGFDPKTSLKIIEKLEVLGLLQVKKGDRTTSTILKPTFKQNVADAYSIQEKTMKGSQPTRKNPVEVVEKIHQPTRKNPVEVVEKIHQPTRKNPVEVVEKIQSFKENSKENIFKETTTAADNQAQSDNWESLFLERIQKFSKEVKGEKLTRVGFGNSALLDIITFCLESDNGITPLDMLERKLKAFKESQVPFIAENRSKFTLHLLRQVWDQLPIIESPQIAQNQSIGDFKLAKGVHLPEIEVTPEERQETLLKYGTFD